MDWLKNRTVYQFVAIGFLGGLVFLASGIWLTFHKEHLPFTWWAVGYVHRTEPMVFMLDLEALGSIVGSYESGLHFIAAPTFPSEAETLRSEMLGTALRLAKSQYEYVIADLPHDFSEVALQALDTADMILLMASPDMASIRAVTAALDTYDKLDYPKDKIKFVLNAVFPQSNLSKDKLEAALGMTAFVTIPYTRDVLVEAINLGQPVVSHKPDLVISNVLEDLAFHVSKDTHRKSRPEDPSDAWQRVYKRFQERKK